MLAAGGGHGSCLSILLEAVRDTEYLDVADANGRNASHYASLSGEAGALAQLANAGACLDLPSGPSKVGDAMHPAHLAVAHGFVECLEQLSAWNADLEATDGAGETVLSLAVQCGSEACAEFLLLGGDDGGTGPLVDPNLPGRGQEPPLHAAARRGRLFLLSLLLRAGADPAVRDRMGETVLHAAARFGQVGVVKALRQAPSMSNGYNSSRGIGNHGTETLDRWWSMTTNAGETATFLAAREGYTGVCCALNEVGALDSSRPNNDGVTPLMVAALAGHEEASIRQCCISRRTFTVLLRTQIYLCTVRHMVWSKCPIYVAFVVQS